MNYRLLRNIHLLTGIIALPFLLMYGVSAVQMAHNKWFNTKPRSGETTVLALQESVHDPQALAAALKLRGDVRGKLPQLRVVRPGSVTEVNCDAAGNCAAKTNTNGPILILNRLHHAAGLWPNWMPLKVWGIAIGVVSLAAVLLSITGLLLWWQRKQERSIGLVLLVANLLFAVVVLGLIRSAGP